MYKEKIRLLLVDDDEDDYILTRDMLNESKFYQADLKWASSFDEALAQIKANPHDVFLLDYRLGAHDGLELLQAAVAIKPHIPIILLTGQGDHDVDLKAMRAGAADYLTKERIDSSLLERSIRYAMERKKTELEREKLIQELKNALAQVKTLSGLLPICSSCKNIRDDRGYWKRIDAYIQEHSNAEFTHSLCPNCIRKYFPDINLEEISTPLENELS